MPATGLTHQTLHDKIGPPDDRSDLDGRTQTARIITVETHETSLVGVSYTCDYACEEEMGAGALRGAFSLSAAADSFPATLRRGTPSAFTQADLTTVTDSLVVFRDHPHDPYRNTTARAAAFIDDHDAYATGATPRWKYDRMTVADLRNRAKNLSIPSPSRAMKQALIDAIALAEAPSDPTCHAAWFATGHALAIPRGTGTFATVIDHLIAAAEAGTLIIGSIGQAVFGSGLTIFDSRDIGPLTRAEITEITRLHDQRMADLEPVAKALKARGYGWYFLGNPTVLSRRAGSAAAVHYWLNGHGVRTKNGHKQPFGWYTADELLAEKFMTDLDTRHGRNS